MTAAPINPEAMFYFRALHRMQAQLMAEAFGFALASDALHDQIRGQLQQAQGHLHHGPAASQFAETTATLEQQLLTALTALKTGDKDRCVAVLYDVARGLRHCQDMWPEFSIVDHAAGCSCCLTQAA